MLSADIASGQAVPDDWDLSAFRTGAWRLPSDEVLAKVPLPPEVMEAVERLEAPTWEERERAEESLLKHPGADDPLLRLLAGGDISAEQRHRLIDIVRRRIMETPRGALGVRMRPSSTRNGVSIIAVLKGMPAVDVLKEDDRIIAIDGQPVDTADDLSLLVQSRKPGESVEVTVMRPRRDEKGRLLTDERHQLIEDRVVTPLKLGSFDDLNRFDEEDPFGFGASRMSAYEQQRLLRAAEVLERFAPKPVRLEALAQPTSPDEEDLLVSHPFLAELERDLRDLRIGAADLNEPMLRRWRTMRDILRVQVEQAAFDPEAQVKLERILEEFEIRVPME